jgi:NAD(P)-dependent dehydrogenase (short-subunit alcohol dehydrogenase family)
MNPLYIAREGLEDKSWETIKDQGLTFSFFLVNQYYGGMPRLAMPQELGGAYVYLLSDAASYTTGIDIPVAGIVGAWWGRMVQLHITSHHIRLQLQLNMRVVGE